MGASSENEAVTTNGSGARVDVAISTTGVGGPDPDGGHAPGTVFLGWATPDGVGHQQLQLGDDTAEVLRRTVDHAVEIVADLIRGSAGEDVV